MIVCAIALASPSVFSPFFIDENLQTSRWNAWRAEAGRPDRESILNTYFVFVNPSETQRQMDHGLGLWWTAPDLRIAFWRPLSAATHVVDHLVWPGNTVMIHLHALAWFAALLVALAALYRRFLPGRVATLAMALYAWDDARGMVFSWIANRHALIGGLFGVCVLLAHDKWRRDGWRPGAWLAPALFALGMLSSEMAIATTGFLFGHALWLDRGPWLRRMARLAPYLFVVLAWQVVYAAGGYGAAATGGYVDPRREPIEYLLRLIERAPTYALAQLTPVDSMFAPLSPPWARVLICLLGVAVVFAVARAAWARLAAQPQSRFWLTGAALALPPICTSATWDRQLVFVGFGVAPLVAMFLADLVDNPPATRWPRVVAGALVAFNLVLGPLMLPAKSMTILGMSRMLPSPDASIPRDPAVVEKTLVVPWIMMEAPLWYAWSARDAQGIPKPGKARVLAVSFEDVQVARTDAITLRMRPKDGFFPSAGSQVFRSSSRPFHTGDTVQMSEMRALVTETTDDGRPQTVEFTFSKPLESPDLLWLRGARDGLLPWTPPKIGESVVLPATRW